MIWADELAAGRDFKQRMYAALNAAVKSPKVQSADEAAKAAYDALLPFVDEYGQPETELFWKTSKEAQEYNQRSAFVSWESGPYQWACGVFLSNRLAEPYYSFDLVFYEAE